MAYYAEFQTPQQYRMGYEGDKPLFADCADCREPDAVIAGCIMGEDGQFCVLTRKDDRSHHLALFCRTCFDSRVSPIRCSACGQTGHEFANSGGQLMVRRGNRFAVRYDTSEQTKGDTTMKPQEMAPSAKDGSITSSYETIGYHGHTAALLQGFLDSGVPIRVYRYSELGGDNSNGGAVINRPDDADSALFPSHRAYEWEVWGGYEGQEYGDHWATFETEEQAVAFRDQQCGGNSKLILHVSRRRVVV